MVLNFRSSHCGAVEMTPTSIHEGVGFMGWRSGVAVSCGGDHRSGWDIKLLWCRLAAVALIQPLEVPCAPGVALKKQKKKKKKKKKKEKEKRRERMKERRKEEGKNELYTYGVLYIFYYNFLFPLHVFVQLSSTETFIVLLDTTTNITTTTTSNCCCCYW